MIAVVAVVEFFAGKASASAVELALVDFEHPCFPAAVVLTEAGVAVVVVVVVFVVVAAVIVVIVDAAAVVVEVVAAAFVSCPVSDIVRGEP